MSGLTEYALADFLLFSEAVYRGLFWRAAGSSILAAAPGAVVLVALFVRSPTALRLTSAALALGWGLSAALFLPVYSEINWAAAYVAPLFWLEAALLVFLAVQPAEGATSLWRAPLAAIAVGWPLLSAAIGGGGAAAEPIGIAPDPTALATLALAAGFGRRGRVLIPIPVLVCLAGTLTWAGLGSGQALALGLATLALLVQALYAAFARR